jgi:hypothetical protein
MEIRGKKQLFNKAFFVFILAVSTEKSMLIME